MNRFPEELKVIPAAAWVIAVCTGVGFASFAPVGGDSERRQAIPVAVAFSVVASPL